MSDPIVGRPPTGYEKALGSASGLLNPDRSIQRLDDFLKFLLGLASLAGVILTGFGLFAGANATTSVWILVPVSLFAVSFAIALLGMIPRTFGINVNDLEDVSRHYDALIRSRASFAKSSGLTFALALIAAPLVLSLDRLGVGRTHTSRVSAKLVHGSKLGVSGKVEHNRVPAGQCVAVAVVGTLTPSGATSSSVSLLNEVTFPDRAGRAISEFAVEDVDRRIRSVAANSWLTPCAAPVELRVPVTPSPAGASTSSRK